ncbi:hypothetical protein H310_14821 [Aphanomyces invadans]|uniref:Uncharacterized protein n=1 Tax=Aphanomyces invadans TaxID=157072 RepID=A0A024T8V9_9STRA|nr:hypothetical protein H310_14821 [Aphanomyces invadans]ETV90394.1 hypothetical protein H310_14821 [Aphanomyces invadans]|eukprot:XP_008880976.1 hypothetical protein H310_14821 [Aphanomyces invadans]
MVAPPSYAKQVVVRNDSDHTLHVTGVFGSDGQVAEGNAMIRQTVAIGPHESATLGEHEYNMGTWTAIAPVYSVHAEHPQSNHQAQFKPQVRGVVSQVHVVLSSDDNAGRLSLAQTNTVE